MPWKALRSNTAGGRTSRRHSLLEKRDPPSRDGHHEVASAEPIPQSASTTENQSMSLQPSHSASGDSIPALVTRDTDHASKEIPQSSRHEVAAGVPKSHRFSLLRFRHASDPQLSRSYNSSATSLIPPLPNPTSKCVMERQPNLGQGLILKFCHSTHDHNHSTDSFSFESSRKNKRQIQVCRTVPKSI